MALVTTTASSAILATDTSIVVASATGFTAGFLIRVDQEMMRVTSAYTSGTTIPVIRGQDGTAVIAHANGVDVTVGTAQDWQTPVAQTSVQYPIGWHPRTMATYSASGAIALPAAGADALAILNGTTALAMTVAAPGKDLEGSLLWIASNAVAAHTVQFTGGLSGAGSAYDVLTINATAPVVLGPFMAIKSLWMSAASTPISGTVTNITAGVA